MRTLGHVLLWAGFLAASFVSVSRLEQVGDKWSTIPWLWYAVSMAVGIVGIGLLRASNRELDADHSKTDAEFSLVQQSLAKVCEVVDRLCRQSEYDPATVLHCIDEECVEPFSEFAEARQSLVKRFGLEVYADVMTEFASAERYVNRSWSAAADGYVEEIAASLARANHHLQKTAALLNEADSQFKASPV